jgi:hypothetical protein
MSKTKQTSLQEDEDFLWQDQQSLDKAWQNYLQRKAFTYDPGEDPLYRQYEAQQTRLGQLAMEDTLGAAAALTGGYANSYGQVAGQQVYQDHLRQLGEVVPELYDRAYDRYRAEGEALYDEVVLRQQQRDQAYEAYRDGVEEAYDRRQDAYKQLRELIEVGYQPTDEELEEAGMTRSQADALRSGSVKTGGGGGSGSSNNDGVSRSDIKKLQKALNKTLGTNLTVDGLWGSQSSEAAAGLSAKEAWDAYNAGTLFDQIGRYPVIEQQINWAHIEEELKRLSKNGGHRWDMERVLTEALNEGIITMSQYNQLYVKYCN